MWRCQIISTNGLSMTTYETWETKGEEPDDCGKEEGISGWESLLSSLAWKHRLRLDSSVFSLSFSTGEEGACRHDSWHSRFPCNKIKKHWICHSTALFRTWTHQRFASVLLQRLATANAEWHEKTRGSQGTVGSWTLLLMASQVCYHYAIEPRTLSCASQCHPCRHITLCSTSITRFSFSDSLLMSSISSVKKPKLFNASLILDGSNNAHVYPNGFLFCLVCCDPSCYHL